MGGLVEDVIAAAAGSVDIFSRADVHRVGLNCVGSV